MPFKYIEAVEKIIESIDEHYDEDPVIVQEADIFIETDTKIFNKVERKVVKEVIMSIL